MTRDPSEVREGDVVRVLALGIEDPPLEVGQVHAVRDVFRSDDRIYVDLVDHYDCHLSSVSGDRWEILGPDEAKAHADAYLRGSVL